MSTDRQNKFHGNVAHWITKAQIETDYFIHFIKAWIAFNSWYSSSYPAEITDNAIFTKLKKEVNDFRSKILNLLNSDKFEALEFKKHIAKLHLELERNEIPSPERKITFTNLVLEKNTLPSSDDFIKGKNFAYKVKIDYDHYAKDGTQKILIQVFDLRDSNNPGRMHLNQNEWDIDEMKNHQQFKLPKITHKTEKKKVQSALLKCYHKINPNKPSDLLLQPKLKGKHKTKAIPDNCIVMNADEHIYFINDPEKIASGLITILYDLRNKLFHGEICPTNEIQVIYREAFYILNPLIKILIVR